MDGWVIQIECLGTREIQGCVRLSVFDRPAMKSHVLFVWIGGSVIGILRRREANRMSLVSLGQALCVRWILQLMGEGFVTANRGSVSVKVDRYGLDGSM